MASGMAKCLSARAREWGFELQQAGPADITILIGSNARPRINQAERGNEFWVECRATHDDDGTYQELPAYRYGVGWTDAAGEPMGDFRRAETIDEVPRHFVTFLREQLPKSDAEADLLRIGQDSGNP